MSEATGGRNRRTEGRRPRIADVAREAGVSKTSVSFAFNSPNRLNPATARRIRGVAETLGYRPDPVARMLTQRRTAAIGVLTPRLLSDVFANPFFAEFTGGVGRAAESAAFAVEFVSPIHGSLARAVARATVDGVVAVGLFGDHPEVAHIRQAGIPIVLVDSAGMPELPSVETDDEAGAAAAARHLLAHGHRDFLVIGFEPPLPAADQPDGVFSIRLRGYLAALLEAGIEPGEVSVVVGPADAEGGRAAFARAWEDGLRPTAVVVMSDIMAIGVLRAAREIGLDVPRDLSVVGFDDIDVARYIDPPLTTIHQPIARKGEEAVRLLLSLIEGREPEGSRHVRFETRLVIRASTGPAPATRQEVASADGA